MVHPCRGPTMSNLRTAERLFSQRPDSRRPSPRRWSLLALCWLGSTSAVLADPVPIEPTPSWLQLESGLSVDRETLDTRWSSVVRIPSSPPDYSLTSELPRASWNSLNRVPTMIEVAPTHIGASDPQVYLRPQIVLGGSSESLTSLLRDAGINASGCMAPLMRMHSSFAGSTSRASVSVSARCSIH